MWPFSKKKHSLLDSGLLQGMTDFHCHILPGVDDGVQTMDEALHTLQELEKLGIRELWLTPHIMEDYPNTPADLRRRFDDLNALIGRPEGATLAVRETGRPEGSTLAVREIGRPKGATLAVREIGRPEGSTLAVRECSSTNVQCSNRTAEGLRLARPRNRTAQRDYARCARMFNSQCSMFNGQLTLHLAAEHMLDSLFSQRLAKNEVLPISLDKDSSHPLPTSSPLLLVETSYFNPPMNLYDQLDEITHCGYTPLLAHPERYTYMHSSDYRRLHEMGVLFQLNLLSLCGAYGGDALHKSRHLLSEGLYTCYGTDLHNLDDFLGYASDRCLTDMNIDAVYALHV